MLTDRHHDNHASGPARAPVVFTTVAPSPIRHPRHSPHRPSNVPSELLSRSRQGTAGGSPHDASPRHHFYKSNPLGYLIFHKGPPVTMIRDLPVYSAFEPLSLSVLSEPLHSSSCSSAASSMPAA